MRSRSGVSCREGVVHVVLVKYPAADAEMAALAATLDEVEAEPWEGDTLTLLDGGGRDTGIHFRGVPVGQERLALESALRAVARGDGGLTPLGRAQARELSGELWILTTPA